MSGTYQLLVLLFMMWPDAACCLLLVCANAFAWICGHVLLPHIAGKLVLHCMETSIKSDRKERTFPLSVQVKYADGDQETLLLADEKVGE
eukprot:scaffold117150_cov22-Tisochrysis_lutea.AAC.2